MTLHTNVLAVEDKMSEAVDLSEVFGDWKFFASLVTFRLRACVRFVQARQYLEMADGELQQVRVLSVLLSVRLSVKVCQALPVMPACFFIPTLCLVRGGMALGSGNQKP